MRHFKICCRFPLIYIAVIQWQDAKKYKIIIIIKPYKGLGSQYATMSTFFSNLSGEIQPDSCPFLYQVNALLPIAPEQNLD